MTRYIITAAIILLSFAFGFTLRGDLIYGGMIKNMGEVMKALPGAKK